MSVRILTTLSWVAAIGLITMVAAWTLLTDGVPSSLTVRNDAEAADCTIFFEKGDAWKFSVAANESAQRFFLAGRPEVSAAVCKSGSKLPRVDWETVSCFGRPDKLVIRKPGDAFTLYC